MTTTVIVIIVGAILINLVVNYISCRVDREPSVPNYLPNNGVDDESLIAVPALVEKIAQRNRHGPGGSGFRAGPVLR